MKKRSLDEYQVLRDLGQGAYGKVFLARDKLTDKIVAIKSVNKQTIIQLDKKRHVYREKTLLSDI
jgi:serine/threonine protein kinase